MQLQFIQVRQSYIWVETSLCNTDQTPYNLVPVSFLFRLFNIKIINSILFHTDGSCQNLYIWLRPVLVMGLLEKAKFANHAYGLYCSLSSWIRDRRRFKGTLGFIHFRNKFLMNYRVLYFEFCLKISFIRWFLSVRF